MIFGTTIVAFAAFLQFKAHTATPENEANAGVDATTSTEMPEALKGKYSTGPEGLVKEFFEDGAEKQILGAADVTTSTEIPEELREKHLKDFEELAKELFEDKPKK